MPRSFSLLLAFTVLGGCGAATPRTAQDAPRFHDRPEWRCVDAGDGGGWSCAKGPPLTREERRAATASTNVTATTSTDPPLAAAGATSIASTPVAPAPPESMAASPESPAAAIAATPLERLPPDFYAVQLAAVTRRDEVEALAERLDLERPLTARIERDGALFWVLLLGIYPDRAEAERAATAIPSSAALSPWVRSVGSLQQAMARAAGKEGSG
jgi:septal ring-binding cell division protein DamX